MTTILAIDPCAEREVSCTGWAFGEYEPQTPFRLLDSGVIEGGFPGLAEEVKDPYSDNPLHYILLDEADLVLVEHYVPYNKAGDPTPLLAEGVVRCVRPDVVLQPSSALALVSEVQAKALYPEIRAQGHHADNLSALRHLLAYLVKNRHKPTLRAFTSIARQR